MTDWRAWHEQYDDAQSSLARRLTTVQAHLRGLLAEVPVRSVLSLCSGDGRDLLPVLAELPADERPEVTLVELDPQLAAAAKRRAEALQVAAAVVEGDAGSAATWQHAVPVDLMLLCGVFGNISDADVRATVDAAATVTAQGGTVVWTCGRGRADDRRPRIREWFRESGFTEIAFDSEPDGYGVGVARLQEKRSGELPLRLFAFTQP